MTVTQRVAHTNVSFGSLIAGDVFIHKAFSEVLLYITLPKEAAPVIWNLQKNCCINVKFFCNGDMVTLYRNAELIIQV